MKLFTAAAIVLAAAAAALVADAAPATRESTMPFTVDPASAPSVAGRWIIKLKPSGSKMAVASFLASYKRRAELSGDMDEAGPANKVERSYSTALHGMAGAFTDTFLDALRREHARDIDYIVPDGVVTAFGVQTSPPSWGLTRVSQRTLNLAEPYRFNDRAGEGVDVFVIDTGVYAAHADFGGRASMNATFVTGEPNEDRNGHGTHCAGTIAGNAYGVAKKAKVLGVKVLNGQGSGTWAGVIAGVDHVAKYCRKGKTVVSMSLGGGKNQALNDAMDKLVAAGCVAVVAAGNNNGDACDISPASASKVFTVAATDNTDAKASYSNWGKCVKVHAPGSGITSSWIGNTAAKNTISGTSMATPHVAGVAALLMSQRQYNAPEDVHTALTSIATPNVVKNNNAATPNLLLFNGGA